MQLITWPSYVILILTGTTFGRQKPGELTLTDVHRDKKLVSKPIASIPVRKGSQGPCLAHCLMQSGKCKSINVNMGIGICEILGESKMEDDSLEMREETGWTYYGPKQEAPREVCDQDMHHCNVFCHHVTFTTADWLQVTLWVNPGGYLGK